VLELHKIASGIIEAKRLGDAQHLQVVKQNPTKINLSPLISSQRLRSNRQRHPRPGHAQRRARALRVYALRP
jgi:hypothetical protein